MSSGVDGIELRALERSAARRTAVRLAAPQRFGKTSVLHAHVAALRDAGLDDALRVTDDVHRATWRSYGVAERHVLRIVAEGHAPTGVDARRGSGLSASTLGDAAERLLDEGQQLARDGRRWWLVDPLLAAWLRRRTA